MGSIIDTYFIIFCGKTCTQINVSVDLHEYTSKHHTNQCIIGFAWIHIQPSRKQGVSTFVWSWGSIFYVYMIHILSITYRIQRNEPISAQKWRDSHLCMSRGLNLTYTISPILVWDRSWWGLVANQLQLICGPTWTGLVRSWSGCPKSGKQKDQLRSGWLQIGVKDWTRPDFKTLMPGALILREVLKTMLWQCVFLSHLYSHVWPVYRPSHGMARQLGQHAPADGAAGW